MRKYIDILNEDYENDDHEDAAMMAQMDSEKHVDQLIRFAFDKIGLTINHDNYAVSYNGETREAEVQLEEIEITLDALLRLRETGLSQNFSVVHGADALNISFVASPDLDHASIPRD